MKRIHPVTWLAIWVIASSLVGALWLNQVIDAFDGHVRAVARGGK
jgi:hypothetical protein